MKSNQLIKKIALLASGIAVFALSSANAADAEGNVGNETNIVNSDTAPANPDALCPNGQPRGTRSEDCTIGQNGRKGRGGNGCKGQFSKGRGGKGGKGHMAQGRGGRGNAQGRRGMGPGQGQGNGKGPHDGSCVLETAPPAES